MEAPPFFLVSLVHYSLFTVNALELLSLSGIRQELPENPGLNLVSYELSDLHRQPAIQICNPRVQVLLAGYSYIPSQSFRALTSREPNAAFEASANPRKYAAHEVQLTSLLIGKGYGGI